jgi:hypothetical protein
VKTSYYIVNEFDRPYERLIAAMGADGKLYYISRVDDPSLMRFDGMTAERATPLEDFGIRIEEDTPVQGKVTFTLVAESKALYRDGSPRRWQGSSWAVITMLDAAIDAAKGGAR